MSRLEETIRTALELEADVDLASISYRDTPAWDSVAHLQLLTAIEEEYELTLEPDELMAMTNYASIRAVVERRSRGMRP